MKSILTVTCALCITLVTFCDIEAAPISQQEVKELNDVHTRWWGKPLEWRFDELPRNGTVDKQRMPWSGYIYPDGAGGCINVLRRYDWAFNGRRGLAAGFEHRDIEARKKMEQHRAGLFGRRLVMRRETPHWAGHCNGWTAAAIRHAEPVNSVTRNGVIFRPSDIKGLLAELYVYSGIETLGGGREWAVHPATLHVVLTNWIGHGKHSIGMDNTLGEEVWNYPIYAYKSRATKHSDRAVEVRINVGYVNSSNREYDRAPQILNYLQFHYQLDLDSDGKIVGGSYYRDSSRIDLLWVPLQPSQGGQEGHEDGNPYLNVKEVLALWRDSVPTANRANWYNINPTPEDAIVDAEPEEAVAVDDQSDD